ncbi:glutamate-5-semialdehyde dehydrogenase [Chengkuizengella axinellae]|uniref:Gamma-glutamyl phosphate reductase n=1 Tax=Chengkuizengella axinellae TaxID=3064388 RepID=A0ABT9IX39_9BACL|nr:glutamate-5-semialdehyde dehydrogenase [Chengkuizengella sp. 2205SS18-9]MDP5273882.1 glutamate-5-semialdehyde dehydrogenase [Chengkuizengella sp. 2205SS18-9]
MSEVKQKAELAKKASMPFMSLTTKQKNDALNAMADALVEHQDLIISANEEDLQMGRDHGLSKSLQDRLAINAERIKDMSEGLRQIVNLKDPIGEQLEEIKRPNGLVISKIRVPIGVIGMIYEARPNVTVDAAGLSLKTGNAVVLRGGSSALKSNQKIVEVLRQALRTTDISEEAIQLIHDPDRASVNEMLKLNGLLDVVIPRGGASLIQNVVQNATVPVIETGAGICHTYIDEFADPQMAINIAFNAKVQRPSVCNAMETLLVHQNFAKEHFSALAEKYREADVQIKGNEEAKRIVSWIEDVSNDDYATEYNDYILNVKVVRNIDEAIEHIHTYGTKHSECIVTKNQDLATRFLQEVDATSVYHNASTRFTDGFEFGFGAEIGISTQKLHARGPMGLPALTSTKYNIYGTGQIKE